jgi:hypothetical protein
MLWFLIGVVIATLAVIRFVLAWRSSGRSRPIEHAEHPMPTQSEMIARSNPNQGRLTGGGFPPS